MKDILKKILVIGQAPPAVAQKVPYDTTMLYDWLAELGITKDQAQDLFEFEAVYDKFPGHGTKGHIKPTQEQMEDYWISTLSAKVVKANKIWILGNVAKEFLEPLTQGKDILYTMHPSKRNKGWYEANKEETLMLIEMFLYD